MGIINNIKEHYGSKKNISLCSAIRLTNNKIAEVNKKVIKHHMKLNYDSNSHKFSVSPSSNSISIKSDLSSLNDRVKQMYRIATSNYSHIMYNNIMKRFSEGNENQSYDDDINIAQNNVKENYCPLEHEKDSTMILVIAVLSICVVLLLFFIPVWKQKINSKNINNTVQYRPM